jgi:hypothetical protein
LAIGAATSTPGSRRIRRHWANVMPPLMPDRKFGCTCPLRRSSAVLEPRGRTSTS